MCDLCGAPCPGRLCPECEREIDMRMEDMQLRLKPWLVVRRALTDRARKIVGGRTRR